MALQQALVTITGNVGNDPTLYGKDPAKPACVFRMGCTRRYLDKTGTWQQLPTTWIAVKAFRSLALNIMGSIRKGNPVIVCGVLGTEEWAGEDGEMHSRLVLEASNVGHDLNYVTTICRRMVKESTGEGNDERAQAPTAQTTPPSPADTEAAAPVELVGAAAIPPSQSGGAPETAPPAQSTAEGASAQQQVEFTDEKPSF